MPIDDFFQVTPVPPLGVEDLGVSPLGAPPEPPMVGRTPEQEKKRKLLLIATLIGTAIGGRKTLGFGQGMLQSLQQQDEQQRVDEQGLQDQFARDQTIYAQQQRQQEQDARQRQQDLLRNREDFLKKIPTIATKAEYEQHVQAYTEVMQAAGYRLDANWWRRAAPYVAPGVEKRAAAAFEAWRKPPDNEKLLKEQPEIAYASTVLFDKDGEGQNDSSQMTVRDLMVLAGSYPATGADGQLVFSKPGTTLDAKANADGILQDLIAQDLADGKRQTPTRLIELRQLEMKKAREATDLGPDPVLNELRELRLAQAKNAPTSQLSPQVQRRVDALSAAFRGDPAVKRTNTMAEGYNFAKSIQDDTNSPSDDQALIYAFAKVMDPESVVREGEYATVQKYAQSWAQQFGFSAQRVFTNSKFLSVEAVRNMKETLRKRYVSSRTQYDNAVREYARQINRATGEQDGEDYLIDYAGAFPAPMGDDSADPAATAAEKLRNR